MFPRRFCAEDIDPGATEFKCAPPLRSASDREGLWLGLSTADIDMIATDHSPCPPSLKGLQQGDFFAAWGGVSSLELALAAVWTAARDSCGTLRDHDQEPMSGVAAGW